MARKTYYFRDSAGRWRDRFGRFAKKPRKLVKLPPKRKPKPKPKKRAPRRRQRLPKKTPTPRRRQRLPEQKPVRRKKRKPAPRRKSARKKPVSRRKSARKRKPRTPISIARAFAHRGPFRFPAPTLTWPVSPRREEEPEPRQRWREIEREPGEDDEEPEGELSPERWPRARRTPPPELAPVIVESPAKPRITEHLIYHAHHNRERMGVVALDESLVHAFEAHLRKGPLMADDVLLHAWGVSIRPLGGVLTGSNMLEEIRRMAALVPGTSVIVSQEGPGQEVVRLHFATPPVTLDELLSIRQRQRDLAVETWDQMEAYYDSMTWAEFWETDEEMY